MANQNLSQFTEKLFVADADHTFIWDTVGAISKRVSRNSWLNSGTLTSDAPVTISQTWDGTGSTVFTALKVNATTPGTTSSSSSLLLDLQVGGVSKFRVTKASSAYMTNLMPSGYLSFQNDSGVIYFGAGGDLQILRDAANTLALRNGDVGQTFNIYGTYTGAGANYARLGIYCAQNGNTTIATQANGTGVAGAFIFSPSNTERMRITTAGNVGIGTTAPGAPLEIRATAATGIRENLLKCTVSDGGNSAFHIYNATVSDNSFIPGFSGSVFGTVASVVFVGQTNSANDSGTSPLVLNSARLTSSETDPNNGTLSAVVTRPLFGWSNHLTSLMQLNANGNLGIGTTSPTSKLQVSAGDVEVDTIAKGVILKSPDGTRYRVTVANGGILSVAAV